MIEVFRRVRSHHIAATDFDGQDVYPSLAFVRLGVYPSCYWRERGPVQNEPGKIREVVGLGCAAQFEFHSLKGLKDFLYHYEDFIASMGEDTRRSTQDSRLSKRPLDGHVLPPLFVTIPFNFNDHSTSFSVPAKVVVPSSAIVRDSSVKHGTSITFYSTDEDFSIAEAALAEILKHPRQEPDFSTFLSGELAECRPDVNRWKREFFELEKRVSAEELLKVVLAHQFKFPNDRSLGLSQLLRMSSVSGNDNRFRFLMASSDSNWLYSRSPERLLSFEGPILRSEALGGTLRSGEKCCSEKLDREHIAIVEQIDRDLRMNAIVPQWGVGEPEYLDLGKIQHLWHPVRGVLPQTASKTDILFSLHPTPAVCGLPKAEALKVLENFESFDRGLYGGPLGVIHGSSWDFMVGLRTVFSADDYFSVPIGVGVVSGSRAEEELAEIYAKLGSV